MTDDKKITDMNIDELKAGLWDLDQEVKRLQQVAQQVGVQLQRKQLAEQKKKSVKKNTKKTKK